MQVRITDYGKGRSHLPHFEIEAFDKHGELMFLGVAHTQMEAEQRAKKMAEDVKRIEGVDPVISKVTNYAQ